MTPAGLVGEQLVAEFIMFHISKDPLERLSTLTITEYEVYVVRLMLSPLETMPKRGL